MVYRVSKVIMRSEILLESNLTDCRHQIICKMINQLKFPSAIGIQGAKR